MDMVKLKVMDHGEVIVSIMVIVRQLVGVLKSVYGPATTLNDVTSWQSYSRCPTSSMSDSPDFRTLVHPCNLYLVKQDKHYSQVSKRQQ